MRLIDAEPWAESIQKDFCDGCNNYGGVRCSCCKVEDILVALEEAPTIEAKPVVHAHWEEHREFYEDEGFEGYYYSCSNCGGTLYGDVEGFNFCHCCGAQMDEVVE